MKRFSSGMYVRLAFAVAAHLDTEILLVDEVLAVGDAEFQRRCIGKMGAIAGEGRTVLLVTHQLGTIVQLASRCALLESGTLARIGDTASVTEHYSSTAAVRAGTVVLEGRPRLDPNLPHDIELVSIALSGGRNLVPAGTPIPVDVAVRSNRHDQSFRISITVYTADGVPVATAFCTDVPGVAIGETAIRTVSVEGLMLVPGIYSLGVAVGLGDEQSSFLDFDFFFDVLGFEVAPHDRNGAPFGSWHGHFGPVHAVLCQERNGLLLRSDL